MEKHFHHALQIRHDVCTGCSHCMRVCPTEAIRIRNGKATLEDNRCVDCGECFKACPNRAITIMQDDFDRIKNFKYRIALVPSIFLGQFTESYSPEQIYNALISIGFTHIYHGELGVPILLENIREFIRRHPDDKPLISAYCPAIVRLIQVRFPFFVNNIVLLKQPLDITALYCRKKFIDEGVTPSEIGVFYVTPCAAKIAAVKSPVGEDFSPITGVINMDFLSNKVSRYIANNKPAQLAVSSPKLSRSSLCWCLTQGESAHVEGRSLAIDGIHNVIEFLERLENEDITDIDFLELRACDESCAGGVLTTGNRFLSVERMREHLPVCSGEEQEGINGYSEYINRRISVQPVKPRSMHALDENRVEAMRKMEKIKQVVNCLPRIDCGVCGSPNCQAFATDIAQGKADIRQCIFIQKNRINTGELSSDEALDMMMEVWGKEKFQ